MPTQLQTEPAGAEVAATTPPEPAAPPPPADYSTARNLLPFVGTWAGDDLEELLDLASRTRSEAAF